MSTKANTRIKDQLKSQENENKKKDDKGKYAAQYCVKMTEAFRQDDGVEN